MKILWIGGSQPRHLYYINTINQVYPIAGGIMECREEMIPQPPDNLQEVDKNNFILHFANRNKAENKYFGSQDIPGCQILKVNEDNLNSEENAIFVEQIKPDVVMIFGCGLIKGSLFSALPYNSINLHLGISPRYRGAASLFWPFYFMEPWYAGTTFRYIISEPDAGDVIHQVVPTLSIDDRVHDVACKCVIQSAIEAIKLIELFISKGKWKRYKQKGTGRKFLSNDFRPEHLRVIYNTFQDNLVKQYLEGRLASKAAKLIRQF